MKNYLKKFRSSLVLLLVLLTSVAIAQECVPLSDITGGTTVTSLVPNPSFENNSCCPDFYSQLNCADDWIQASDATSDYHNTCGFVGEDGSPVNAGDLVNSIPNGGSGFAGFYASANGNYQEFIGACLTAPMTTGISYTLEFYLGFGVGTESYPHTSPANIAVFGSTSCTDIPFAGFTCPPTSFDMIATATVSGAQETWAPATFTFTAAQNYTTIIIGPTCTPGTTNSNLPNSYYFVDELIVNETTAFSGDVTVSGDCNSGGYVFTGPTDASITGYQWSLNGNPIAGATGSTYTAASSDNGTLEVQVNFDDGRCGVEEIEVLPCECVPLSDVSETPPSLFSDPSFEDYSCCPDGVADVDECLNQWNDASTGVSLDYMNTCGFLGNGTFIAPGNLVNSIDGNGFIGGAVNFGVTEFMGKCLTTPLVAGTSYSFTFNVGFGENNTYYVSPYPIVLYGTTSCANLPYSDPRCPDANYTQITSTTVSGAPETWVPTTFTFTPTQNYAAIVIGPPCTPGSSVATTHPQSYYFYDNFVVNETALFETAITVSGDCNSGGYIFTGPTDASITGYQWSLNGTPIPGATGAVYNAAITDDGTIELEVTFSNGTCGTASTTVEACGCIDLGSGSTGGTNVTSLIPNPSFENYSCCPSFFSELNCADDWIQASSATSDYFNTCGFTGNIVNLDPGNLVNTIPNGGSGFVGYVANTNSGSYSEFVGACLTSPMTAGTSYTLEFFFGFGLSAGNYPYTSPTDVAIYGTTNCADIPFSGFDCPPATFDMISTATISGASETWVPASFTFTAAQNYTTLMIGPPCTPGTTGGSGLPSSYFFVDDLIFAESSAFSGAITATGDCCTGFVLDIVVDGQTITDYQWFLDGNPITGATGATYTVPVGDSGTYSVEVTFDDGSCGVAEIMVDACFPPLDPVVVDDLVEICEGEAAQFDLDAATIADPNADTFYWFDFTPNMPTDIGSEIATGTSLTPPDTAPGTYTYCVATESIVGTDGTSRCYSNPTCVTLEIYALPITPVLVDNLIEICAGDAAQFDLDAASAADPNTDTFYWFDGMPNIPADIGSEIATGTSLTPPDTAPGTYTYCVVGESVNGANSDVLCYGAVTCMTLEIYALPSTPALVDDMIEICAGEPAQFDLDAASAADPNTDTFYWFDGMPNIPADIGSEIATGTSLTPPDTAPGTYTYCVVGESVNGTNSDVLCYGAITCMTLEIYALPSTPALVDDAIEICAGDAAQFDLDATSAADPNTDTFYWFDGMPNIPADIGSEIATGTSLTPPDTAPGTYTYCVVGESVNGANSDVLCYGAITCMTLEIYALPGTPALVDDLIEICAGEPAQFDLDAASAADPNTDTFYWFDGMPNIPADIGSEIATGTSLTPPDTAPGTYTYCVVGESVNGANSDVLCYGPVTCATLTIYYIPDAPIAVTGTSTPVCNGDPSGILAINCSNSLCNGSVESVSWYEDDGTGNPDYGTVIATTATFDPIAAGYVNSNVSGDYTFFATCSCNGCEGPPTDLTLSIFDPVSAFDPIDVGNPPPACASYNQFTVAVAGGFPDFSGFEADPSQVYDFDLTNNNPVTFTPSPADDGGVYNFTNVNTPGTLILTITDGIGCGSALALNVYDPIEYEFDEENCGEVNISSITGGWDPNDGGFTDNPVGYTLTISGPSGTFTVGPLDDFTGPEVGVGTPGVPASGLASGTYTVTINDGVNDDCEVVFTVEVEDCCLTNPGEIEAEFNCPSVIDLDGVDDGSGEDLTFPMMGGFMGDAGTQQLPNYYTYLLVVEASTGNIVDVVLVAYTDPAGVLVDSRPISIPYTDFQAYPNGTGMDYQFYLYNFYTDNPPANGNLPMGIQVPIPTGTSDGMATNVADVTITESPIEGCYSLSYFNEEYIPNPLMQTCNEQISEGDNGGALPIYYNTREFCISGGSPPYDFAWHTVGYVRNAIMYTNGDEAGMQVEYADNATWECVVTDVNGCTAAIWSFNNNGDMSGGNDDPVIDIVSDDITNDLCMTRGTYEGSVSIVVEGGSGWPNTDYEYVWTGPLMWDGTGQGTATISNCPYGWYSVTVTEMQTGGVGEEIIMGDQTEGWFWVACERVGGGRGKADLTNNLVEAYPNPLGSQANIEFGTPIATEVRVAIYTIDGRELIHLYDGPTEAQTIYNLDFDTRPLANGVYILQMQTADGKISNQRIVVAK